MSKVTPATIIYTPSNGVEQTIDFHAVIMEDHATQATITKYPVQEGFHVSNHSIRNNRVVTITGVINNMRMTNYLGEVISGRDYGEDAAKKVKEAFDALIHSGQECRVVTNLGDYSPVVFSKFKTQQKAGMVDSMQMTATGEEIIKVNTESFAAPVPVAFIEVTGPARDALVKDLSKMGIEVGSCDKLSQGDVGSNESFVIDALDVAGNAVNTTFEFLGNDPVSGAAQFATHAFGLDVATDVTRVAENSPCAESSFLDSVKGGLSQVGSCLLNEADDFVEDQVERHVDTALGKMTKSLYGVFYDTVTMDSSSGQVLATAGLGCIIRGVTGTESEFPYQPGESLPTSTEILAGDIFPTSNNETLTKLECACDDTTQPVVDTSTLPI